MHNLKHLFHFVGRLAEDERAGDIRLIALDGAAVIQQHQRAFANYLGND